MTFSQAERAFYDPFASEIIDYAVDYGEERLVTVGMVGLEVFVVVWAERRSDYLGAARNRVRSQ